MAVAQSSQNTCRMKPTALKTLFVEFGFKQHLANCSFPLNGQPEVARLIPYDNRTSDHPDIQFTFLGYTFRPRKALAASLKRPIAGLRLPDWPKERVVFSNGAAGTATTFTIPG